MKLFVEKEGRGRCCWTLAVGSVPFKSLTPLLQNNPPRLQHPQATVSTALWLTVPQEDPGFFYTVNLAFLEGKKQSPQVSSLSVAIRKILEVR